MKNNRILYHSILILLAFVLFASCGCDAGLLSFGKLADPVSQWFSQFYILEGAVHRKTGFLGSDRTKPDHQCISNLYLRNLCDHGDVCRYPAFSRFDTIMASISMIPIRCGVVLAISMLALYAEM